MNMSRNTEVAKIPEFLSFRRMIAPDLLQFFFWPIVIIGIYYNTWLMVLDGYSIEWWSLVSGILMLRAAFECLILYTYLRKTG